MIKFETLKNEQEKHFTSLIAELYIKRERWNAQTQIWQGLAVMPVMYDQNISKSLSD